MNSKEIQKRDQAGHTKLTLVTIGHGNHKMVSFVPLMHNDAGQAILPQATLDKLLDKARVRRGDTYTVG